MPKHETRYKSDGFFGDWYECTCGWKSTAYWDGAEHAQMEAEQHIIDPKADQKTIRNMIDKCIRNM